MLKKGLNRSQIARKLSGEIGDLSYNEILMSHYKAVKRAENKAKQIIEHIREEIKNNN